MICPFSQSLFTHYWNWFAVANCFPIIIFCSSNYIRDIPMQIGQAIITNRKPQLEETLKYLAYY